MVVLKEISIFKKVNDGAKCYPPPPTLQDGLTPLGLIHAPGAQRGRIRPVKFFPQDGKGQ